MYYTFLTVYLTIEQRLFGPYLMSVFQLVFVTDQTSNEGDENSY